MPPIAPHGHAAAERLGQADDVGRARRAAGGAAGADGEAGLHLVEGQQRAVLGAAGPQAGEVAGLGRDDAGVHHDRLEDHPGDLGRGARRGRAVDRIEVVERHDADEVGDRPAGCRCRRARGRVVGRADRRRRRGAPRPPPSRGGRGSSPRP